MDKLLAIPSAKKEIIKETPYKYSIRVAYQTPAAIDYNGTDKEAIASLMFDSKKSVSRMLNEDIERQAVRRMVRQAQQEQQISYKEKSKEQER